MMLRFRQLLLLAIALSAVAGQAGPAAAAGGLAPDGDFEAAPFAFYYTHGTGAFTWATDRAYSGTHSLKIVSAQPAGQLARWMTNTDAIRATPGTSYAVSARYFTQGVTGQATLDVSFWNASWVWVGTTVTSASGVRGDSGSWRTLDLQATAPAGTTFMRVEFRLYGPGTLWVDDVSASSPTVGPPVLLAPPSISGADVAGQAPVGDPGSWGGSQPITFTTTWYYCSPYDCTYSEASTPGTYAFPYPDYLQAGYRVVFEVTAQNAFGTAYASIGSGYIQPQPGSPPALTGPPLVSGTASVGETLLATAGTWIGADSTALQWVRCSPPPWFYDPTGYTCTDIPGAVSSSYVPTAADAGSALRVRVTASNANGSNADYAYFSPHPGLWLTWSEVVGAQSNLVPNPDVEAQPDSYYTHGTGMFSWATDASRSGSHSLKIESAQAPGGLARWMTLTDAVRVTPGAQYEGAAWLETSGVAQGAGLSLTFWDASWTYLGTTVDSVQLSGAHPNWVQLYAAGTAPPGSSFVRLEVRLWGPGTVWADDLSVVQTPHH